MRFKSCLYPNLVKDRGGYLKAINFFHHRRQTDHCVKHCVIIVVFRYKHAKPWLCVELKSLDFVEGYSRASLSRDLKHL